MLYLVSTPIGNLKDLSQRAISTLEASDYILAEDTRHSKNLLNHYKIATRLVSYHQFNEAKSEEKIISDLLEGKEISLISDAGMPGISDPGERLVKRCREEKIAVTAIGGPSAFLLALVTSGLSTKRFQFVGFLPKTQGKLEKMLVEIANYPGTSIAYESPNRIVKLLQCIEKTKPTMHLVLSRELTKQFEETLSGSAQFLLDHFEKCPPKGEFVVLFKEMEVQATVAMDDLLSRMQFWLDRGLEKNEALKTVAKEANVPRREVYKRVYGESDT